MRPDSVFKVARKYLVGGVLFGACFPLGAWTLDLIARGYPFSPSSIVRIHDENIVHFIVDTAPLVLGGVFFLLGRLNGVLTLRVAERNRQIEARDRAERIAELAEEETVAHGSNLQLTLDYMGQGLILFDDEWNLIAFNRNYQEHFDLPDGVLGVGTSFEEVAGTSMRQDYGERGWRERLKAITDSARKTGVWRRTFRRPSGRYLDIISNPIPGGGFVITSTDITYSKRTEAELEEKERLLNTVLTNMSDGIYALDADLNFTMFNDRYVKMVELADDFIAIGEPIQNVVFQMAGEGYYGPGDPAEHTAVRMAQFRSKDRVETELETSSGQTVHVRQNALDDGGAVVTLTDTTKRREFEEGLKLSNRDLATLSECNEAVVHSESEVELLEQICRIIVKTKLLRFAWVGFAEHDTNKTIRAIAHYGYEKGYLKDIQGSWDDTERGRGPAGTAIRNGKTSIVQNAFKDPRFKPWREAAKERGYGSCVALPLMDGQTAIGVIVIFSSEKHGFDADTVRILERLADNVAFGILAIRSKKARLLAEHNLKDAKEEADNANQVKSRFLANMSHEIRTPLSAVSGFLELLEVGHLDERQRQYVKNASIAAKSLVEIIGDVLDFSKIEAGYLDLHKSPVPLFNLVLEVVSILAPRGSEKGNHISVQIAPDVPSVIITDPIRLKQILINVTGNAVKFTEDGLIHIALDTCDDAEFGRSVRVCVTDTGIGFDPAKSAALFEEFAQADSHTTRRFGGTGLGLAISRRLVELMGGRIWNHGESGNGAEFWFTLPADVPTDMPSVPLAKPDQRIALWCDRSAEGASDHSLDLSALEVVDLIDPNGVSGCTSAETDVLMVETTSIERARKIARTFNDEAPPLRFLICDQADFQSRQGAFRAGFTHLITRAQAADDLAAYISSASMTSNGSDVADASEVNIEAFLSAIDPELAGLPILLIDDMEMNLTIAGRQLERLEMAYDTARNGKEALDLATSRDYALIIVDCSMPVMDGYEFTEHFRQWERDNRRVRRTPVVAMTANATVGDAERCIASGMDDYMAKPVNFKRIAEIASRWLSAEADGAAESSRWSKSESVPVEPNSEDPINMSTLAQAIASNDAEDHLRMLIIFREALVQLTDDIDKTFAADDQEGLRESAHAAAGAAANIGANKLSRSLIELETEAVNGGEDLSDIHGHFHEEADKVLAAVAKMEARE